MTAEFARDCSTGGIDDASGTSGGTANRDPGTRRGPGPGAGAAGGLSNTNKVTLLNRETGELIETDPVKLRLGRMRRRVKSWAETVGFYLDRLGKGWRLVMVTLTYRPGEEWHSGDVGAFMRRMRRRLGAGLLAYAWVAELQLRGAVHYHVLLLVKQGTPIPKPDEAGIWRKGATRVETARSPFYVVTYTGKEYQKAGPFPKGLRMFAVWVRKDVTGEVERWVHRLSTLPRWLSERVREQEPGTFPKRHKGGGWMLCGVLLLSPWVVTLARVGA